MLYRSAGLKSDRLLGRFEFADGRSGVAADLLLAQR
jgi:hypothetical protein